MFEFHYQSDTQNGDLYTQKFYVQTYPGMDS